jgi:AcrR family transcriptional regulator
MANYKKGTATRQSLVTNARLLFNKKGINITLIELAEVMDVSIGSITNHYRTKDHLFVAISKEYQQQYLQLNTHFVWNKKISVKQLANYFSIIMDLQYEYRCAIISAASTSNSQKELYGQINETYKQNKASAKKMVALFVQGGLLDKNVLEKKRYEIFSFLTICMMTTWVISHEMYDKEKGYKKMKSIYLEGILSCFVPYFTVSARKEWGNFIGARCI